MTLKTRSQSGGCLLLGVLLITGCAREDGGQRLALRGSTMGTTYTLQLAARPSSMDLAALEHDVGERLDTINALLSTWDPDSELSQFNRSRSTDWFGVAAETCSVVAAALDAGRLTDGRFDVTIAPLVDAWGFGPTESIEVPSAERIDTLLQQVGIDKLETDCARPALRKLHPALTLNLGGYAKGYAVDALATLLTRRGSEHHLVEIGGEVRATGTNSQGQSWRIAIESVGKDSPPVAIVGLRSGGFATSGSYRNFVTLDGRRYSHLIDPQSGRPVPAGLAAVSVQSDDTATADALATALMVLGPGAARRFVEAHSVPAVFQFDDGRPAWVSPAMQPLLK